MDATGIDHDMFGSALKKALYNYMQGVGLDLEAHEWFEHGRTNEKHRKKDPASHACRRAAHNGPTELHRASLGLISSAC